VRFRLHAPRIPCWSFGPLRDFHGHRVRSHMPNGRSSATAEDWRDCCVVGSAGEQQA
jgi:hypothetical protein